LSVSILKLSLTILKLSLSILKWSITIEIVHYYPENTVSKPLLDASFFIGLYNRAFQNNEPLAVPPSSLHFCETITARLVDGVRPSQQNRNSAGQHSISFIGLLWIQARKQMELIDAVFHQPTNRYWTCHDTSPALEQWYLKIHELVSMSTFCQSKE
jgi:hypothetical protein